MRAKAVGVDRALQVVFGLAALSAIALGVILATGASGRSSGVRGTGTPVATAAAAAGKPPVLPTGRGKPGFPPKVDSPALTSQEILPNFVSGFPGIPTSPSLVGYPAVKQITINGMPIYTYAEDSAAGDVNGQGVSGVWWAIAPDGSMIGG